MSSASESEIIENDRAQNPGCFYRHESFESCLMKQGQELECEIMKQIIRSCPNQKPKIIYSLKENKSDEDGNILQQHNIRSRHHGGFQGRLPLPFGHPDTGTGLARGRLGSNNDSDPTLNDIFRLFDAVRGIVQGAEGHDHNNQNNYSVGDWLSVFASPWLGLRPRDPQQQQQPHQQPQGPSGRRSYPDSKSSSSYKDNQFGDAEEV